MRRLLDSVIEAHGGANRWDEFSDLVTDVDVTGRLCEQEGWSRLVLQSRLLISLRNQRTIVLLTEGRGRIILETNRLLHMDGTGSHVEMISDPGKNISHAQPGFKWDVLRTAYLLGNVIRHSVTAPFVYACPGFVTEEVAPWNEDGEVWQVLRVTFPEAIAVPSRVQYAYYGPDGLLRRLRNTVPLLGGISLVEYVASYGEINGIRIPLSKDVFACDSAGHKLAERQLGHIELRDLFLTD